jgi:septum formation protein
VLASASPRRAELLRAAGFTFSVAVADVDETERPDESPEEYVRRLALAKAVAVSARHSGAVVLGADTTVVIDGAILAKPADAADAARMIGRLAGRAHLVHTGVALARDGECRAGVATTTVWFTPITEDEIAAYVASGEPMDKAGAYGIQGAASRFVRRIDGPYDNVVGLPLDLVRTLLRDFPGGAAEDCASTERTPASGRRGTLERP